MEGTDLWESRNSKESGTVAFPAGNVNWQADP